jgi:chromosome segregation ATPase
MKTASTSLALVAVATLLAFSAVPVDAASVSPINKVLQMISDLQSKVIGEGEEAQKVYSEFSEWCEDRSMTLQNEIKTGKSEKAELEASIDKAASKISSLETKVETLSGELAKDEADLKAATDIRQKEHDTFAAEEKELMETVEVIQRAVGIIEKEMKGGASMMQLQSAGSMAQALSALVQASSLSAADGQRLTALVQSSSEDGDMGAPAAAAYESHSGGIVETLTNLLEESEDQLEAVRNKETKDSQAFEMLQQSLKDEMKYANKELNEAKGGIAEAGKKKASFQGDLEVTAKDLSTDIAGLAEMHHECMTKAEDFEAETKSRGEELAALAKAKEIIKENVAGAEFDQVSLLQVSRLASGMQSRAKVATFEVEHFVRNLARKHRSTELAQLAARISTNSRQGEDVFGKIKGLIQDMVEKLEKEAEADAKKKAYCDKELAETKEKKTDKTTEIDKLGTEIDSMTARSGELKEEVAALEKSLSELASAQAEMDKIRAEEKEIFTKAEAETAQGLKGVKLALKVLKEYYAKEDKAHSSAQGAGDGIIGLLEVCESDFTKSLAELRSAEETAQSTYEDETKENEIEKTTKSQDVKYKTKESTELDATIAETTSDRENVQVELDAVLKYLSKIEEECIAKAETFEERQARFEAELAGLKEALRILESETALLQKGSSRKALKQQLRARSMTAGA